MSTINPGWGPCDGKTYNKERGCYPGEEVIIRRDGTAEAIYKPRSIEYPAAAPAIVPEPEYFLTIIFFLFLMFLATLWRKAKQ